MHCHCMSGTLSKAINVPVNHNPTQWFCAAKVSGQVCTSCHMHASGRHACAKLIHHSPDDEPHPMLDEKHLWNDEGQLDSQILGLKQQSTFLEHVCACLSMYSLLYVFSNWGGGPLKAHYNQNSTLRQYKRMCVNGRVSTQHSKRTRSKCAARSVTSCLLGKNGCNLCQCSKFVHFNSLRWLEHDCTGEVECVQTRHCREIRIPHLWKEQPAFKSAKSARWSMRRWSMRRWGTRLGNNTR